ncbi:DUF1345 domain-containing protein [Phormidesmis priestleyi]
MKLNSSPNRSNLPPMRSSLRGSRKLLLNALNNLDSRRRIGLSAIFGMLVFLGLPDAMQLDGRTLGGWIAGVACFLGLVLLMMSHADPQKTYYRAQRQEAQHWTMFLLVLAMALTSIFAIALMLAYNKETPTSQLTLHVGLSVIAILCSWFLTHTMFALHYATCYYREDSSNPDADYAGGVTLPSEEMPDYLDFMYFSFTIGMTSQTSDVSIVSSPMRRLSLGHGVVSFFFYSVIIALSVGVVGGLI